MNYYYIIYTNNHKLMKEETWHMQLNHYKNFFKVNVWNLCTIELNGMNENRYRSRDCDVHYNPVIQQEERIVPVCTYYIPVFTGGDSADSTDCYKRSFLPTALWRLINSGKTKSNNPNNRNPKCTKIQNLDIGGTTGWSTGTKGCRA